MIEIFGIVAMDNNGGIGINNNLPWPHNPEDIAWFKEATTNSLVVMGRSTWEGLPFKLPNRTCVVLTSGNNVVGADVVLPIHSNMDEYRNTLQSLMIEYGRSNIAIIGGTQTFYLLNELIDTFYITQIDGEYECDVHLCKNILTNNKSVVRYVELNEYSTLEVYSRFNM